MKNNHLKGLLMTVIAFVAAYKGDNIEAGINWGYVLISTIGISVVYIGKNALFQSTSEPGVLNWRDALSGLIVAVGAAISSFAASVISIGEIDWKALIAAVIAVIVGYFGKTFATNSGKIK